MIDDDAITETVQMTPAMIRKLARLTALHSPDAVVQVVQRDNSDSDDEALVVHVEWLDEYGHRDRGGLNGGMRAGFAAVIRENGWSNPSVARVREAMARA